MKLIFKNPADPTSVCIDAEKSLGFGIDLVLAEQPAGYIQLMPKVRYTTGDQKTVLVPPEIDWRVVRKRLGYEGHIVDLCYEMWLGQGFGRGFDVRPRMEPRELLNHALILESKSPRTAPSHLLCE